MEIKKILKELEDLKFDSYDNIVNEVLDCITKNQNELFENKKDAKHLFLHILDKYNIYFSLMGLESSLYLYKRKLETTKIKNIYPCLLYGYESDDFDKKFQTSML